MTALCNAAFTDARQRQLFKNIIYIGALSALFDIEFEVLENQIGEQFKGKEKLIEPNIKALKMGVDYVKEHFEYPLDLRVERRDSIGDSIMMSGNTACALGAIYAGATVAAWYPITPSTSVVDAFSKYAEKLRIDKETGKEKFRHRAGGRRTRRHRNGSRRELERSESFYGNERSGNFFDERIFRTRLFCRNPDGFD